MIKLNLFPPAVIRTSEAMPAAIGAITRFMVVSVREKYIDSNDTGIVLHELEHVKQFWVMALIGMALSLLSYLTVHNWIVTYYTLLGGVVSHSILYLFVERYRRECELRAYTVQFKEYNITECPEWLLAKVVDVYSLKITTEEFRIEINKRILA